MGRRNLSLRPCNPLIYTIHNESHRYRHEMGLLLTWIAVAFISRYLSEGDWWLTPCFGLFQWFAMSSYLPRLRLWAIASILGWSTDFGIRQAIALSSEQIWGNTPSGLPFWLTYGSWTPNGGEFFGQILWDNALSDGLQWSIIGLVQWWLVLHKLHKGSEIWILASACGGCLQGVFSTLLGFIWGSMIATGLGTIGYSIVTGFTLIYLKQKNYKIPLLKGRWIIHHKI
jgi:hypothetical protein